MIDVAIPNDSNMKKKKGLKYFEKYQGNDVESDGARYCVEPSSSRTSGRITTGDIVIFVYYSMINNMGSYMLRLLQKVHRKDLWSKTLKIQNSSSGTGFSGWQLQASALNTDGQLSQEPIQQAYQLG